MALDKFLRFNNVFTFPLACVYEVFAADQDDVWLRFTIRRDVLAKEPFNLSGGWWLGGIVFKESVEDTNLGWPGEAGTAGGITVYTGISGTANCYFGQVDNFESQLPVDHTFGTPGGGDAIDLHVQYLGEIDAGYGRYLVEVYVDGNQTDSAEWNARYFIAGGGPGAGYHPTTHLKGIRFPGHYADFATGKFIPIDGIRVGTAQSLDDIIPEVTFSDGTLGSLSRVNDAADPGPYDIDVADDYFGPAPNAPSGISVAFENDTHDTGLTWVRVDDPAA